MSLIVELQRRNVFRVSAAYLALGWIVAQVTGLMIPALHLPESVLSIVVWIGVIGFPFVVVFAWAYEITPEGLKREREIDRSQSITHITARRLDGMVIALLLVAIGLFLWHELRAPAAPAPVAANAAPAAAAVPPGSSASLAAAEVDEKSIAVLPFVNISEDPSNEYFADGISEELLNLLARIPELQVTSRSSAFAFKGEKIDIPVVAAKLHVAHVLEGSVRKAGNRVRITAQLVDARRDKHLWSESYDRDLTDVFAVQDEIAAAVVAQLRVTLLGEAPKARVAHPEAYSLFLQARQLRRQGSAAGLERALKLCEQAVAIDPDYAAAWDEAGRTWISLASSGFRTWDETHARAAEVIDRALSLDPGFARAHDNRGFLATMQGDLGAAAGHYQRALQLEPGNLDIIANAGNLASALNRLDLAISLTEYSQRRDPANPIGYLNLGALYVAANRPDDAIAMLRNTLDLAPDYIAAHFFVGLALLQKGEAQAALEEMQREPDAATRDGGLVMAFHTLGRGAESDAALASLIQSSATTAPYFIASTLAWRGDSDRAFEWLDKAAVLHDGLLTFVVYDPLFAGLRNDPRWLPMLHELGKAPEQLAAISFEVSLPK